jgi:hypothetical protein
MVKELYQKSQFEFNHNLTNISVRLHQSVSLDERLY